MFNRPFLAEVVELVSELGSAVAVDMVSIYVAGLLLVVGGVVVQVMRQIEFGVKLYLLLHVAVAISN